MSLLCGMNQKDIKDKVVLRSIGVCPVCGKGKMIQGTAGWTCNHFKDFRDMCSFTIFGSYCGYVLTEKDAVDIITRGYTEVKELHARNDRPYSGILRLVGEKIEPMPVDNALDRRCPFCGGRVLETGTGWMCENYNTGQKGERCKVFIPKTVMSREVTRQEAETLLAEESTEALDGFIYEGKEFSSRLVLEKDKGCRINGKVCACPKCGGDIYIGRKAYNCSNFRVSYIHCDFVVWRQIYGHRVTIDEVRSLCKDGKTGVLEFFTKDGTRMERTMVMDKEWKVRLKG